MINKILSFILAAFMLLSGAVLAEEAKAPLSIAEQGMFSAGGTVTGPVEGDYDPTTNWQDATRAGNTAHVDHANVLGDVVPAQRPQRLSGGSAGSRRSGRAGEHVY